MTAGRVNLKIVADRLGLARRCQGDLEAFARELETAAARLAGGTEDHEDLPRPPSSVE